jgi:ribonuclease T1
MTPRAVGTLAAVLVLGIVIGWAAAGISAAGSTPTTGSQPPAALGTTGPTAPADLRLGSIRLDELPIEAAETIELIKVGGPFPFRQDGVVFENREALLPARPSGYYREYTVPRPGNNGRGALRIVAGADGELYWTPDHYDSFRWIER